MKKKLRTGVPLFLLAAAIIIVTFIPYTQYMTRQVRNESAQHLEEIFSQVNTTFSSVVSRTWDALDSWEEFIMEKSADEDGWESLTSYMEQQKEAWGFNGFYFLDKDGNYLTLSMENGYFDLGDNLFTLMNDRERIVGSNTMSDGTSIFLFAVPVREKRIGDFEVQAIAVSYSQHMLIDLLKISAFDNTAECFIISSNGAIAMASMEDEKRVAFNYLAYLKDNARFLYGTLDTLRSDIRSGNTGMTEFRVDNKEYYLVHLPVGLENWTMLGLAPKDVVNANMNELRLVTMSVAAALFFGLSMMVIYSLVRRSQSIIRGKDTELKYRDQLFNLLTNNEDDVFVMFSADSGKADYVSPNVERLLGISEEQVRADIFTLEQTLGQEESVLALRSQVPVGENLRRDGYRINLRTGERRWYCAILYHELVDFSEKYILLLSDRTDEKKNDERLIQALDVAQNANAAKSTFLSNMSHDIRTPLNGIIGMTAIAQANLDKKEKVEDCLDKISFSSRHLLGLINDILDMSKIESGKMTLSHEQFSIAQLVEGVMEIIRPQAEVKGQTLETAVHVQNNELLGDTLRLSQVLLNLLSNAVKYTQNGGKIRFAVEELEHAPGNYAHFHFTVEDNGQGMSAEFLKTIFEPFSREKELTVSKTQGTGLGMSICKGIVELMGGIIYVDSTPGEGSVFDIELSLRIQDDAAQPWNINTPKELPVFDYQGKRFLIAEDNELNAEIICQLLAMQGAQTTLARDGRQVLEIFSESPAGTFDIILMDVQMPVMNGYESTRAIRSLERLDARGIPIVAMTADAFTEDIKRAREAGMNAHVAKPLDMAVLSETLSEVAFQLC